jgi:ammonia channel protein AmtB
MQQLSLGLWFGPYLLLGSFTGLLYIGGSSGSVGYATHIVLAVLHIVAVLPLVKMWRERHYKDDAAEISGMALLIGCVCSYVIGLFIYKLLG